MRLKRDKYIDLIMYLLSKSASKPNFGKTVLCSIMYFIDFNHYEAYGRLLTNERYVKSKRGIRPVHFRDVVNDLVSRNCLFFRKEPYYTRTIHKFYPLIIPDVKFKPRELDIINYSLEKLSDNNASSITRYAVKDPPIMVTPPGEEIDFRYVFSRNEEYSIFNK